MQARGVSVLRHLCVPALPGHATPVSGFVQLRVLQMEQPAAKRTMIGGGGSAYYGIFVPIMSARVYIPVGVQRIASGREVGEIDFGLGVVHFWDHFGSVEHARFTGHVQEGKVHVEPVGRTESFVGQHVQDLLHISLGRQQSSGDEFSG